MKFVDLASAALRKVGVLAVGEVPSQAQMSVASFCLQQMLGSWATQRMTMYYVPRLIYNLVSNQQDYTIGPGGDFDQPRPVYIDRASAITNNNPSQPLELALDPILDTQAWQAIPVKAVYAALPTKLYYNYGFDGSGRGLISIWPIPNVGGLQLAIYPWMPIQGFTAINNDYEFPPGYDLAITYGLVRLLAHEYRKPLDPDVVALAVESLATVKRANIREVDLQEDPALLNKTGTYDWRSDSVGGYR